MFKSSRTTSETILIKYDFEHVKDYSERIRYQGKNHIPLCIHVNQNLNLNQTKQASFLGDLVGDNVIVTFTQHNKSMHDLRLYLDDMLIRLNIYQWDFKRTFYGEHIPLDDYYKKARKKDMALHLEIVKPGTETFWDNVYAFIKRYI